MEVDEEKESEEPIVKRNEKDNEEELMKDKKLFPQSMKNAPKGKDFTSEQAKEVHNTTLALSIVNSL